MRAALARLAVIPFETAIAVLLIGSGTAQLARIGITDPVQVLLPAWEAFALSAVTIVTGLLMVTGTAAASRGAEIAGLLLLAAVIADRFLLYGWYLGFGLNFAVTGVFDSAVIWAALARLATVRRGETIIRVRNAGG